MGESLERRSRKPREGIFSAVSAGVFFIFVGIIFVTRPDLFEQVLDFLRGFGPTQVPNTQISLLAPLRPNDHLTLYRTTEQFSFFWAIFQLVMLAFRFAAGSPLGKKAETVSNFVFWIGAYFIIGTMLIRPITLATWFAFWSVIIMLIGASLIVRAIALAAGAAVRST